MSSVAELLFGRRLASQEESEQKVGPATGVPIFGLDALGSAVYGPEAALTLLLPLGAAGLVYMVPITVGIVALLAIVYLSYRQTIAAYPAGAGSYTVARFNLGARFGMVAAAALMIDYLLNVAVGISTGVGALVSAMPRLQPHTLSLCLGILLLLTIVNLRGVRESGVVFMLPTYLFLSCMLATILLGVWKSAVYGGHPMPLAQPPAVHAIESSFSIWLILKAFSSGCTAMTGVEAVSNGVQIFREPVTKTAQRTLTAIIVLLMIMLIGIAYLVNAYRIGATEPGQMGYESVVSQMVGAVAGKGGFYFICIGAVLLVLSLSANTSFAAFPRLCRSVAQHGYLPYGFADRGRRLVPTTGSYVLAAVAALLLIAFRGVTDRLIPLFAIGAFLSFTFSQAGMVMHWHRSKEAHAGKKLAANLVGATATGIATLIILIAKFNEGAWMTVALIAGMLALMGAIRRHYHDVAVEVASVGSLDARELVEPIVVVPIEEWNRVAKKALQFALTMSSQVQVLHVQSEDQESDMTLRRYWDEWVQNPDCWPRRTVPKLVMLNSPYRVIVDPIFNYVMQLESDNPDRQIAVVISDLVERHWFQSLLHNQRARVLTSLLTRNGDERIVVVNVPWYFHQQSSRVGRAKHD